VKKLLTPQEFLHKKGMKATNLRLQVLELFFEKQEPLSHAAVFEYLAALGRKPDRVTLYRVLSAFSDAQIVREIQGIKGPVRFCLLEPSLDGYPRSHPHFLCQECGRMLCLRGQLLPRVEIPDGTVIEGKQFLIFGLCPICSERTSEK